MTSSSYFRFPHLHGDLVTFVAEDDVWIAPLDGGRAWRVSSLQLPARNPRFTPDGKRLVWTVVQGTAPEVVSAQVDGGGYRQLTYFGHSTTKVKGFTTGGSVVVTSAFRQAESRHTHAYSVPLDGGWAQELPYGPVESVAFGPEVGDERPVVLASVLSREPAWWKRYRGGTAGKLWIDRDGNGEFERLLPDLDGNLTDPLWVDGRIAFLSDHEGYGNLYSVLPSGRDLRRHTDHQDFYVRHAATDGKRVIFESAGELWVLHDLGSDAVKLDISLGSASQTRRPALLDAVKHLGAVAPDVAGAASAVESHGTIHWLRHKDGPSRIIEATPGVRGRLPRPLGDGRIAYIADHGGVEALHIKDIAAPVPHTAGKPGSQAPDAPAGASPVGEDTEAVSLPQPVPASGAKVPAATTAHVSTDDEQQADVAPQADAPGTESQVPAADAGVTVPTPSRASSLEPSPDGRWVALGTSFGDVFVVDTRTGDLTPVASIGEGSISELGWSADSRWLVWSEPVTSFGSRSRLRLATVDRLDAEPVEVTDGRFRDASPAFTPDGKFLAFLSNRSFDPVYDGHSFDLSFPSPIKPYLVALAAGTPSPFGPSVDPAGQEPDAEAADGAGDGAVPAVTVDPEGLAHRVIGVPVPQGNYSSLKAVDGALLWLDSVLAGVTGDGKAS